MAQGEIDFDLERFCVKIFTLAAQGAQIPQYGLDWDQY